MRIVGIGCDVRVRVRVRVRVGVRVRFRVRVRVRVSEGGDLRGQGWWRGRWWRGRAREYPSMCCPGARKRELIATFDGGDNVGQGLGAACYRLHNLTDQVPVLTQKPKVFWL